MRPAYVAAAVALALGAAGLVRGVVGPGTAAGAQLAATQPGATRPPGVSAGDITVTGAYVREPASPDVVVAYLTIVNSGRQPDTLLSVTTGAARSAAVYGIPASTVPASTSAGAGGAGGHQAAGPLVVPAGATIALAPGGGHLMLTSLTGPIRPGQRVSLLLYFQRAGQLLVDAPVIAIAAPAPTGG